MLNKERNKGRLASAKGFANENRLLAALLERGFNASRVDLPHSTYDIVVEINNQQIIRIQVKTIGMSNQISFIGGVDREYKSSIKEYVQNTKTADIVVGIQSIINNGDSEINFYFIPTLFIENIKQKSISIHKIDMAKNKWEILESCKDPEYVHALFDR